jgi:hypothetical protein
MIEVSLLEQLISDSLRSIKVTGVMEARHADGCWFLQIADQWYISQLVSMFRVCLETRPGAPAGEIALPLV